VRAALPLESLPLDVFLFVFGLLIGSFLNVVIHRMPRDLSIVRPRSRCPSCGTPIPATQNIPVVSWLLLRGRCASCGARISARYPAVEAGTALLFVATGRLDGVSIHLPFHLAFVAILIAVALIDLDFQIIPDPLSIGGFALGLLHAAIAGSLREALLGAALGAGILWGIGALYFAVRRIEGMGGGDVKLAAMLGAFLGWQGILLTIFLSSFFGAVAGILLMRAQGTGGLTRVPYGTFLAPAAILILFVGGPLVDAYFRLVMP
jgi:leader peptidase (prepilin peptidase)/N-methyltransferase